MTIDKSNVDQIASNWMRQTGVDKIFSDAWGVDSSCAVFSSENYGVLSIGLDSAAFRCKASNLNRVFWIPGGRPNGRSVSLVSSRLGQKLEKHRSVFDAIRTFCCRLDRERHFLVIHDQSPIHGAVVRAADLFGITIYELRPMPVEVDLHWFEDRIAQDHTLANGIYYDRNSMLGEAVQPDRLQIELSHEVRVLHVRKSGNIFGAIQTRLQGDDRAESIYVLHEETRKNAASKQLIQQGAIDWYLFDGNGSDSFKVENSAANQGMDAVESIEEFSKHNDVGQYVLHWTRRRFGPWPDQLEPRYHEDLLLGTTASKHDRISTLTKILVDKKLIASNDVTRDDRPVVSFSEVGVDQLTQLRTFRSHLSRWDFETLGIAIKKDVLKSLGGRGVVYGGESCWQQLDADEQPFFQKSDGKIDWSVEKEWRVIGDVDLAKIGHEDAFVFVDSFQNAARVMPFTNFKVVVLASRKNQ